MATSLKTTNWGFPPLTSTTNNVIGTFSSIVIEIPESGISITSAWVDIGFNDIITSTGGTIGTIRVDFQLESNGSTGTTASTTLSNSGENIALIVTRDFTTYFQNFWSGTTMSCQVGILTNQTTGTTLGMNNLSAQLNITYEYDTTSSTQAKSVWIPLNAPRTSLPGSKTSHDTIPALDTYLPEDSKSYKSIFIVTKFNRHHVNTSDFSITYELSSLGTYTTEIYEGALATDVYTRHIWEITNYISGNTNTTHTFNVWSSLTGRSNSPIFYMIVTYTYNASSTTQVMNSVILPLDYNSPMGGTSSSDYQRASREFWIPEYNPSVQRIACLVHWSATGNEAGLNARVGTGSFLAYTLTGSGLIAGDKTMMIRNDTPTGLTFSRGRNTLSVDIYNTSNLVRGFNVGCLWMVNYTSDSISGNSYLNSKTVQILNFVNTGLNQQLIATMSVISIPENYWFISALGYEFKFLGGATLTQGVGISIERLESEGGLIWEDVYSDAGGHDSELGTNTKYAQSRFIFKRWTNDYGQNRLDISVSRRSKTWLPATTATPAVHDSLITYITYHSIYGTVSGYISGSSGGVIDIHLNRYATGETVLSTTQSGNGTYSFIWFDDIEDLFVYAYESETRKGASKVGTMSSGFDINLSSSSGSSEFSYTWYG